MNYKLKNIKDYKQFDTRWAKLSYRVLPACMRLNGCGATALADIICEIKGTDPRATRKWLLAHGYVSANQGTYWAGIPAAMKACGFKSVKRHATMTGLFAELAKGKRAGVILFHKGSRGGRTYTTSGHFCGIGGYKYKNGKHWLYIMDPGPRNNDGWICYESQMYGLVLEVWSGKIPSVKKTVKKPAKKIKKKKNKTTKGPSKNAEKLIKIAASTYKYMYSHGFHYSNSGNSYTWRHAKKVKTSNCATYVSYSLQRIKLLKGTENFYCSKGKIKYRGGLTKEKLEKIAKISSPNKSPKKLKLLNGDIVGYKDPAHTMIYAGKNKNGDPLWYTYGPTDAKAGKMPRHRKKYDDKKISHLIRLK